MRRPGPWLAATLALGSVIASLLAAPEAPTELATTSRTGSPTESATTSRTGSPATSPAEARTGSPAEARTGSPTAAGTAAASRLPTIASSNVWRPGPGTTWQIQFSGNPDHSVAAQVFELDAAETPAADVAKLHSLARKAICYVNAGGWEEWRPDASSYPSTVLGKPLDGWPDERWVDVRRVELAPILRSRMDVCKSKGFDGIELDNVDGYKNQTGFSLTAQDQLTFNRWLANEAHKRGLAVGLKNDLDQVAALEPDFDFAINEQCVEFDECERLAPFISAGKAVFHIEYHVSLPVTCRKAMPMRLSTVIKRLNLDAWRRTCADAPNPAR